MITLPKFLIGMILALIVAYFLPKAGATDFLTGWMACTTYYAVITFPSEKKKNIS